VQRYVVEVESSTVHNPIDENGLEYSKGSVATRKFHLLSILVEKEWRLNGQQVVLLINEDVGPGTACH
jgi:hypothetical protein